MIIITSAGRHGTRRRLSALSYTAAAAADADDGGTDGHDDR